VGELLFATLVIQAALAPSLVVTLVWPSARVWPPPSAHSWQLYFTWVGKGLHLSGVFFLGIFAWGSLGLSASLRLGSELHLRSWASARSFGASARSARRLRWASGAVSSAAGLTDIRAIPST
jgi:hypothetical protein